MTETLTRIPDATPGASGGLLIAGVNAVAPTFTTGVMVSALTGIQATLFFEAHAAATRIANETEEVV